MAESSKPRVLITGGEKLREVQVGRVRLVISCYVYVGVGFVGRNLVQFLLDNELASHIRVADKVPPVTAWLNDKQKVSEIGPSANHMKTSKKITRNRR